MFSPQSLPKPDIRARVTDLGPDERMPWEPGSRLDGQPADPGKAWRHEVFGGVYELGRVRDTLVTLYDKDDSADDQREPVPGQSALFACTVDADGVLVEGSAVLSACAWAIGRAVREGDNLTLAGFGEDALRYGDDLGKLAGSRIAAAVRLLAASMREAVPDAMTEGVKAVVAGALAPVVGPPTAAAGAALAGIAAGRLAGAAVGTVPADGQPTHQEQPPVRLDLHPLVGADLQRFTTELSVRLGVADVLAPRHVRVRSYQVSAARAEEETEQSFLNSFYADDLTRIGTAVAKGAVGAALREYLTRAADIDQDKRIDVRHQPAAVWSGCVPGRIPPGRWVTNADRPLALSQQFAVNEIMDRLAHSAGLVAVNGPPGTGKTTMLRDVIAAIVVERAVRLADLPDPGTAFDATRPYRWQSGKMTHWITPLIPELAGFEIVVASSNNGAVENVTTEIPGPGGIGSRWRQSADGVDYFTSTARLVHGEGAWAMVAARLGKMKHRRAFTKSFWWGSPGRKDGCMVDLLERLQDGPPDWPAAVSRFRAALARVNDLSAEREGVALSLTRLPILRQDARSTDAAISAANTELRTLGANLRAVEVRLQDADSRHHEASDALQDHRHDKPGLLISVSTRFRAGRDWHAEHTALREKYVAAERELELARQQALATESRIADAERSGTQARDKLNRLTAEFKLESERIAEARRRWGACMPDGPAFFTATKDDELEGRREKTAPWADEEFTSARTELFLAALALHKAFIAAQAVRFRRNLGALMDILDGKGRPPDHAVLAAWQTLFLVVPVVSTTFASMAPLFAGLGRESVGWLFIDEAGQAAPQQATGAIWRARRVVVVGDPLQLEPVVTLPLGGQRALLRLFGVDQEWTPEFISVQQVADRLAPRGTWLPRPGSDGSGAVWVGTPLRVHRRCDRPMFDISNEIAYDGLMVYGTPDREPFHGRSVWYNVQSGDARGHWIPAEGVALRQILSSLRSQGIRAADLRVISPFRQVVAGAMTIHREVFPDAEVDTENRWKWVGTVHTMQGKEANVVILVLGGNPDRPNARKFATETPNLLNVAVTRARRRLYVIGDRGTWASERYFDVLAAYVEQWQPASQS